MKKNTSGLFLITVIVVIMILGLTFVFRDSIFNGQAQSTPQHTSKVVVTSKAATSKNTSVSSSHNHDSSGNQITDEDVVGVWVNHINKDIHQQITFLSNHTWKENQHGQTNIYSGKWKITGPYTINLSPYDEDIRFTKNNFNEMTVISYDHVLTKNKAS
ncbi:hypothetical protein ACLJJ6_04830 [Pediococcus siamensis]|uniref:hypothetical protein n=1 Tax=Pediococcus siamensis TaxID=381829 RepID=UPI0039A1B079